MKRLSITIVVILMVFTMACSKKSSEIQAREGQGSNSGTMQPAPATTQSLTASSVPVANTAPGMNPPHGQPNHRCDIAVGVPLDSPPGTGKSAPPTASQLNVPTQTATPSTAPGMNPPHGQPNHRCDIAVGVPLDSPPGTGKSAPPTAPQLNVPTQTATPSTAPGMNPPHGQPNHRCDIAVGVPLDSPPGTGKSNSLSPTPIQINPAAGTNGTPSTQKHIHNSADSLNSPPIRIVPAPKPDATGG